jgi:sugar phosphate isomerase/epimerase
MLLGYNTNGLAHHHLLDAISLLAKIGYGAVPITIDHNAINPFDPDIESQLASTSSALQGHGLRCVIETGARFLLDPRIKHEPTLVTADPAARARRVDFLCRAIDIAARLNADCVSLWSGVVRDGARDREAFCRLTDSLSPVIQYAEKKGVVLALEPEPGMLIDSLSRYADLLWELAGFHVDSSALRLTIDIGHLHCQGEVPLADKIQLFADRVANVHIEDMRSGIHEHLMFGEGEIDFPPVIAALAKIEYAGVLGVELSRHSHEGPDAAQRAYDFLRPLINAAAGWEGEGPAEPHDPH